jgi:hypothetical protein
MLRLWQLTAWEAQYECCHEQHAAARPSPTCAGRLCRRSTRRTARHARRRSVTHTSMALHSRSGSPPHSPSASSPSNSRSASCTLLRWGTWHSGSLGECKAKQRICGTHGRPDDHAANQDAREGAPVGGLDAAHGSVQVRDLIYREILEYHPHMLADYLQNGPRSGPGYMYPSAVRAARNCAVTVHSVWY